MFTTCDIEFENNPKKIVNAGQLLRGIVRLNLMDKMSVRSVYIRISGKALTNWQVGQTVAIQKDSCLNDRMLLAGGEIGSVTLDPRTYTYAFEFLLPKNIPSSMEGSSGHIRYTVRVVLDVPLWLNKKFKQTFTVVNAVNLNDDPSLRQPLMVEEIKNVFPLCFACCGGTYAIKLIARTPVGGFVPGQLINLEINVTNQSNEDISQITVELVKLISYFREQKNCFGCKNITQKKHEQESLIRKISDGCGANQDKIIRVAIEVPTTLPSDNSICKAIKVTYLIKINASMPFLYKNPTIDMPVTIGSYPFHDETLLQTDYF